MNLHSTRRINFADALRNRPLQDAPELAQWLKYWNDNESFGVNMRNLEHWINCARNAGISQHHAGDARQDNQH